MGFYQYHTTISIRGFTPAAPLKLFARGFHWCGFLAIRGFTPAAPLKRGIGLLLNHCGDCYPRVHTRGPIEA